MILLKKYKSCYILSHLGLGDHICMIGAVNFLLNYYDTIYLICKARNEKNVKFLFINKNIVPIIIYNNDHMKILNNLSNDIDIFICGGYVKQVKSKIRHPELLSYIKNNKDYKINHPSLNFIKEFYYNINLDLSIYYEYFDINSCENSIEYYNKIKNYNILFLHTKSSTKEIDLSEIIKEYLDNDKWIIVCANKNIYNNDHIKFELASIFVNIPVSYYIDIIKNSDYIHVIDSCFSCIVNPLHVTNRLKTKDVFIYTR